MTISARQVAERLGVSHTAVNEAAKRGRIQREADGKFDFEKVSAAWSENRNLPQAMRRNGVAALVGTVQAEDISDRLADVPQVTKHAAGDSGDPVFRVAHITAEREALKLKRETIEFARMQGELVNIAEVRSAIEERAAQEKEALLNWPLSIAANMAAELGVEERRLSALLDKAVKEFLAKRSRSSAIPAALAASAPSLAVSAPARFQ